MGAELFLGCCAQLIYSHPPSLYWKWMISSHSWIRGGMMGAELFLGCCAQLIYSHPPSLDQKIRSENCLIFLLCMTHQSTSIFYGRQM